MDLTRIRFEMNLTQWQLARKAELSESTIRRIERAGRGSGETFRMRTVVKLCHAYTLSPEEVEQAFDLLCTKPELQAERNNKRREQSTQ